MRDTSSPSSVASSAGTPEQTDAPKRCGTTFQELTCHREEGHSGECRLVDLAKVERVRRPAERLRVSDDRRAEVLAYLRMCAGRNHFHTLYEDAIALIEDAQPGREVALKLRVRVADLARIAHYALDGETKAGTIRDLTHKLREVNALLPAAWTDDELAQLLGRADRLHPAARGNHDQ